MKTFKELLENTTELDEANMSSDRSKRMFKSNELRHELGHEDKPMRSSAPAEPHSVHINGKKWKTFADKNHATNVANKIKGATVVKESEELDEAKGALTYKQEHSKWGVIPKSKKEFVKFFPKNKEDDARSHAEKTGGTLKKIDQMGRSIREEVEIDEASDFHAQAMEHKKQSDAAMDKNDMEAYHHHMSAHHESLGQWHESKGRSSSADKEYEKAEKHHELSLKKSNQKNEGTEMLSFKYFQEVLEEAKKKCKESASELENSHDMKDIEDELDDEEKEELEEAINEVLSKDASAGEWISDFVHSDNPKFAGKSKEKRKQMALAAYYAAQRNEEVEIDEQAPVAPVPGMKSGKYAIMVHPKSKQRVTIERKNKGNYPEAEGWKEVGLGVKLKEEVEELDEISTATMGHAGKTTLKHIKNPGVQLRMAAHDVKPGIKGYRDRVALLKAADAEKKLKEEVEEIEEADNLALRGLHTANPQSIPGYMRSTEKGKKSLADKNKPVLKDLIKRQLGKHPKANLPEEVELDEVSPFDWKAYSKERGTSAGEKTKTFHNVKKTSTGTVYTKQVNPDGTSKGSGEDAAKAAEKEQAPKRGRGRPAGVGAKTGSYKPRDPASKAASAAKAAASKAANRAMRKESFDEEFMSSLIEGFEDEDFDDFLQCEEFSELDEATQDALHDFINEKCMSKMKESLTGKQHKLDKNKNGKLDSHDFKLLRKEETEQIQESVTSYAAFLNKK